MKKYIKKAIVALSFLPVLTSCGDFGDTNIDPEHLNAGNVPMTMTFTNAQHQALGSDWDVWRNGLIYLSQWNQHIAAGGWWWSYGINSYSNDYAASYWGSMLAAGGRGAVRDIQTVIGAWKEDATQEQNLQIARIVRAYIFHRLTDLHGDIPYSEAGQPELYSYPKYDTQESIYDDLLKELDEAQANLGSGIASMGVQDLYYNGDVAKWKKFANSLMLRVAMRLSKVNAAKAKEYAAKAYSNGVITSTADNGVLMHAGGVTTNDSSEPYAKVLVHEDPGVAFINKTFYDILANANDPRIPLIMAVYPEDYATKDVDPAVAANSAPDKQKSLIGFFSTATTAGSSYSIQKYYPEYTNEILSDTDSPNYFKKTHSQPNRSTYGDPEGPTFIVTAAQTNLLLAEAAHRGWISGSAKDFYEAGVRCAMEQFATYPSKNAQSLYGTYLTDEAIAEYLINNPFDEAKALEQINTQYWITCFCDEYETYANWRRSGYPELQDRTSAHDNFANLNTIGGIVRRFPYPAGELQVNGENYQAALNRLGLQTESQFNDTRVWWDVK